MKKLMGLFLLGFGLLFLGHSDAQAAASVRGAKGSQSIFGGVSPIGVSSGTAVLYSVAIGTGAVTDFVVLFDSASANGLSATLQSSGGYKLRVNASSATQNTIVVFDPPLQFKNGIMAANSTTVMTSVITYEPGHVTQGY